MLTKDRRKEIPDKKPIALPLGCEIPEPLESKIARMVRAHSEMAQRTGNETFEEADDFDVEGEDEVRTPYEMSLMQEEVPHGVKRQKVERTNGRRKDDKKFEIAGDKKESAPTGAQSGAEKKE